MAGELVFIVFIVGVYGELDVCKQSIAQSVAWLPMNIEYLMLYVDFNEPHA